MLSTICRDNVRAITQAYAKATGQSVSAVSKQFYGNAGFLADFLRGNKTIGIDKLDSMIGELTEKWPPEAKWPPLRAIVIPRPVPRPAEAGSIVPNKGRPEPVKGSANHLDTRDAPTPDQRRRDRADPARQRDDRQPRAARARAR